MNNRDRQSRFLLLTACKQAERALGHLSTQDHTEGLTEADALRISRAYFRIVQAVTEAETGEPAKLCDCEHVNRNRNRCPVCHADHGKCPVRYCDNPLDCDPKSPGKPWYVCGRCDHSPLLATDVLEASP